MSTASEEGIGYEIMKTATKLILANGLIAIVIMVAYAHFSLGSFHDQEARQAHKELESCIPDLLGAAPAQGRGVPDR